MDSVTTATLLAPPIRTQFPKAHDVHPPLLGYMILHHGRVLEQAGLFTLDRRWRWCGQWFHLGLQQDHHISRNVLRNWTDTSNVSKLSSSGTLMPFPVSPPLTGQWWGQALAQVVLVQVRRHGFLVTGRSTLFWYRLWHIEGRRLSGRLRDKSCRASSPPLSPVRGPPSTSCSSSSSLCQANRISIIISRLNVRNH